MRQVQIPFREEVKEEKTPEVGKKYCIVVRKKADQEIENIAFDSYVQLPN